MDGPRWSCWTANDPVSPLEQVGPDRDLANEDRTAPEDFPAHNLSWALRELPRVGATTASKLIAGKRPGLIPIFDSVINAHMLQGSGVLPEPLRLTLHVNHHRFHHLLRLRHAVGVPDQSQPSASLTYSPGWTALSMPTGLSPALRPNGPPSTRKDVADDLGVSPPS
jgi:hypothetical protein